MTTAARGQAVNLLANGDFERGVNAAGEPIGWHTRLTSSIPIPEYRDPVHKRGRTGEYHFKCGCGYVWGTVRPWAGLVCPKCGLMNTGLEDSGDLYMKNFECVKLGAGRTGHGVHLTLPEAVGDNQGVRVISDLMKADPDGGYELSVDARSRGCHLRVWVEGFRAETGDADVNKFLAGLPAGSNPQRIGVGLRRVYRKQINLNTPRDWQHFSEKFAAPDRYKFDYMFVDLYAYMPGEAFYDNVRLRKLSPAELRQLAKETPPSEDRRFHRTGPR